MIIHHNGKRLTQGAVITSIADLDQWSIEINVVGPPAAPNTPGPTFRLIFARPEFDRLVGHITGEQAEPTDYILTVATSSANPEYFAYNIDARGLAGWRSWIEYKLNDPLYQPVHHDDVVMHARNYGIDALVFEEYGRGTREQSRYHAEHLRRVHRSRLECKP